ncbi:unnamed protein product [Rodentolepis nana]|uniref:Uncharacterized protein n=1 Tax=Rodentolepis nana TaxID=102285 RepID=A0A0R3TIW8_RODNA|nr:unnamed protein product [Rodentolepis nana]
MSPIAGPSTLNVGNASGTATFQMPSEVVTGVNGNARNALITEADRNQSDGVEWGSSRPHSFEPQMLWTQRPSAFEINPPLNLQNNLTLDRTRLSIPNLFHPNQFELNSSKVESRPNRITSLTSISNEPLHLNRIVPTPSPTEHSSLGNILMIDATKLMANVTAGSHMFPSFTSSIPTLSTNVPDTRDLKDIIYPHNEWLTIALEKFKKMPSASTAFVNPFPTSNAQSGSEADVSASFLHGFLSAATERFRSNQKSTNETD